MSQQLILEGTPNFRDLGGMTASDGRTVKPGLIARTEGPHYLTDSDTAKLLSCNFKLICDLRSENERDSAPNDWCKQTSAEILNFGGSADLRAAGNEAWEALRAEATQQGAIRAMTHNYKAMPWVMAPHLRTMIDLMIDQEQFPVLIHCTAGKDRTGFVIAILLTALGISKETIYKDYLLSKKHIDNRFADSINEAFLATFGFSASPATLAAMIGIEEAYLDAAFDSVREEAGSVENYLLHNLGLTDERKILLQSKFLETA